MSVRVKKIFRSLTLHRKLRGLYLRAGKNSTPVFVLHRFAAGMGSADSYGLDNLDQLLTELLQSGVQVVSLSTLIANLSTQQSDDVPKVAFTIDDGYACFLDAARVFRKHGCSATVFLCTRFVTGEHWMWWDKIEFLLGQTTRSQVCLSVADVSHVFSVKSQSGSDDRGRLTALFKTLPEDEKNELIQQMSEQLGVHLPDVPPERYRAMTWENVATLREQGFEFAPHTVTHPILANVGDRQAYDEISGSCEELTRRVGSASMFAYPNGADGDYGEREMSMARRAGLTVAFSTREAYLSDEMVADSNMRYQLPRFHCPNDVNRALLVGLRVKALFQRARSV